MRTDYSFTNARDLRRAFWDTFGVDPYQLRRESKLPDGTYKCDVRCAFVDFVDSLARDGAISERLAQSVTL